jgi:hypothetical protein
MKKLFFILTISSFMVASAIDMPPSIPMLQTSQQKSDTNETSKVNSCDMIPPMLHMLPPPLQGELDNCVNTKNQPTIQMVTEYLQKNKMKYKTLTIKPASDFVRLYEIDLGNKKIIYCNEKVTKCFEVK